MNLFLMELRRTRKTLLVWTLVICALSVMFISLYPSMSDSAMQQLAGVKLEGMPEGLKKAFNLEEIPDFTDLNQFYAYCTQFLLMAGCIFAATLGASALAQEQSEGTIEFLYAMPISRTRIVLSKLCSRVVVFLLFSLALFLATWATMAAVAPQGYGYLKALSKVSLSGFASGLCYLLAAFALSPFLGSASTQTPAALGLFFVPYMLGIMAELMEKLKGLSLLSPYHYMIPNEVIRADYAPATHKIVLMAAICVVGAGAAWIAYRRMDLKGR